MNLRAVLIVVLVLAAGLFILQNTQVVTFQFLFWKFGASRALLPLVFIGVGIVIGLFVKVQKRR